jgi:hypothetical protein
VLKDLALVAGGALAALSFMIACSDDSPTDADAAACTCDPAEPPLAGRLIRVEDRRTVTADFLDARASCPDGSLVLGGGCYTEGNGSADPRLIKTGEPTVGASAYFCSWANPQNTQVTTVAWATCLSPAP